MAETFDEEQWRQGLRGLLGYFQRSAQSHPLFALEAEVCAEIVSIVEQRGVTRESLIAAVAAANRIAGVEHYNGSGWYDLRLRLLYAGKWLGLRGRIHAGGEHKNDPGMELDEG